MKVVIAPDQRLRVRTKPIKKVTPKLLQTTKEMVKLTKSYIDPEGVGLASTQIGEDEQFFIALWDNDKFKAFFNPEIVSRSKKTKKFFEGCLSIPDYYGDIERPISVSVHYIDEKGAVHKERLTGLKSWFFQHEYDHLQGTLMMDHVLSQKARLFKATGKDRTGADIFEEIAI